MPHGRRASSEIFLQIVWIDTLHPNFIGKRVGFSPLGLVKSVPPQLVDWIREMVKVAHVAFLDPSPLDPAG